jgi:hypothetical protein
LLTLLLYYAADAPDGPEFTDVPNGLLTLRTTTDVTNGTDGKVSGGDGKVSGRLRYSEEDLVLSPFSKVCISGPYRVNIVGHP